MRQKWMEFKAEHLWRILTRQTLQTALFKSGFPRGHRRSPAGRCLTFDYVKMHFERYPVRVGDADDELHGPHFAPKACNNGIAGLLPAA
jgi:hypothetical protein